MAWKSASPESDVHSILECDSTDYAIIALAVRDVIETMEKDWLALGKPKAEAVFIYIDATNGHLMFTWDKSGGGANFYDEGWPTYYLELKRLWKESLEHNDGARHFDDNAHMAICDEVGRVLFKAEETGIPEDYEYYEKFEWSSSAERVIV